VNETFWFLARQAGFAFWEAEEWNQNNERIDWSCSYDEELQRYTQLVIQHTLEHLQQS
jgi:hypothetical protein